MTDYSSRGERVERLLSMAVGLAAIVAVLVSLYQTRLAREQLRASAWPHLSQGNTFTAGNPYVRFVSNEGVGPARIRSVRVLVDGKPARTWNEAVRALTGEGEPALVYSSFVRGSVLAPGATRSLLTLPPGARAQRFWEQAQTRLRTVTCYCSVYDECWTADSDAVEPTAASECPTETSTEFDQ